MAVEAKRGCGYRKVGGTYMMGGGAGIICGRLPLPLEVCPTCGGGIKQSRGWTWIEPVELFAGTDCRLEGRCSQCPGTDFSLMGRCGLLWIGKSFYPTVEHFLQESSTMGICRRISAIPRGFVLGETWVFLAHPEAMTVIDEEGEQRKAAGIFRIFKPIRIEKIVTETMAKDEEEMEALRQRDITPVIVPDDDPDHQGTVYDKEDDESETDETD